MKSNPETQQLLLMPENREENEEEQEIGEPPSVSSGKPPITEPQPVIGNVIPTSPSHSRESPWDSNKRRKGKGTPDIMKLLSVEKKLRVLMGKLNPIPFIPHKIPDFARHEKLLRKLGLWDFVHMDFDRNIRVDLMAQLISSYEARLRASYVNGLRIKVNRTDLGRAFKLPMQKKGKARRVGEGLDEGEYSEDALSLIVEFVSDWLLLHDDAWSMPDKVNNWLKVIKNGYPEKVDWAGLFWFMVEKELTRGEELGDCYYASHLQHLIKWQHEELFLMEKPTAETVKLDAGLKGDEYKVNEGDVKVGGTAEDCGVGLHLMLEQGGDKEEVIEFAEIMDIEDCKENNVEGRGAEKEQWLLLGKNNLGEHFMQRCSAENVRGVGHREDRIVDEEVMKGEEDKEEARGGFHVSSDDNAVEGDLVTDNLLGTMEGNQFALSSHEQFRNPSSTDSTRVDTQHLASMPSFVNRVRKRVRENDDDLSSLLLHDSKKGLRINNSWEHQPVDFGMCMEQIQKMMERARMFYEDKELVREQSNVNQQMLLNELQKRDAVIEHLHKIRLEEARKKDFEIYRLERELHLTGSVLDGYRKALKETQKVFVKYRQRAELPAEPTYS